MTPSVYFRVARDLGIGGFQLLREVTLPAIAPQVITALRVTAGLSWLAASSHPTSRPRGS